MATTSRAPTRTSLQLPRPIEPIKPLASEPCGPQTANLPLPAPTPHLFARASCSKQRRPPQPNLHSPNSRPAVQCNEGFCNAPDGQRLTLTTSTASQKPHHYGRQSSPIAAALARMPHSQRPDWVDRPVPPPSTPTRRMRSACCARAASGHATAPLSTATNFRLAILIAIGPSDRGHAHWIIANDSTPQHRRSVTDFKGLRRLKSPRCLSAARNAASWPQRTSRNVRPDVRFSNRPFGVKRFQTIRHHGVDVAHGLVLLFGIGTKGPSIMGFEDEVEQSLGWPCRQTT